MSEEAVVYEVVGHVATITMNRPEVANAQNTAVIDGIDHFLDVADADDEVRVVVLAGAGKHFSAGHDLKALVVGDERRPLGGHPRDSGRQVPPRADHVLRAVQAPLLVPEAHHRPGPGCDGGSGLDAGLHVRPDHGRRRRHLLEPGAPDDRRRGRASGRAVGARHPQGQGVPVDGRDDRRPGGLAAGSGQPRRPDAPISSSAPESWPTGSPSCPRPRPRWSRTPSTTPPRSWEKKSPGSTTSWPTTGCTTRRPPSMPWPPARPSPRCKRSSPSTEMAEDPLPARRPAGDRRRHPHQRAVLRRPAGRDGGRGHQGGGPPRRRLHANHRPLRPHRRWARTTTRSGGRWRGVAARASPSTFDRPEGQDLFRRLVAHADVVCENFRPGTLEAWDVGPEDCDPRLPSGPGSACSARTAPTPDDQASTVWASPTGACST